MTISKFQRIRDNKFRAQFKDGNWANVNVIRISEGNWILPPGTFDNVVLEPEEIRLLDQEYFKLERKAA